MLEMYAVHQLDRRYELFIKPFLVITLSVTYFLSVPKVNKWYVMVLCCSLIGDILMIQRFEPMFFYVGLIFFFAVHLLLIKLILGSMKNLKLSQYFLYSIPFFLVFFILFFTLSDNFGQYFYWILVRTIAVTFLLSTAFQSFLFTSTQEDLLIFIGVFCFAFADCFYVLYRFYDADISFLMITIFMYAVAQYLICRAMIAKDNKESVSLY